MKRENLLEPVLGDRLSQRDLIGDLLCFDFIAVDQHGAVTQLMLVEHLGRDDRDDDLVFANDVVFCGLRERQRVNNGAINLGRFIE